MKNKYEINGDITYIFIRRRNGTLLKVIIDTDDLEKVKALNSKIYADYKKNIDSYYAVTGKSQSLHRLLTNAPKNYVVDHINHNTLDNRKENLRICTYAENAQNKNGSMITSKSGIRGVCWDNTRKNWIGRVMVKGEEVFRKTFKSMTDAERAVVEARKKYMTHSSEAI